MSIVKNENREFAIRVESSLTEEDKKGIKQFFKSQPDFSFQQTPEYYGLNSQVRFLIFEEKNNIIGYASLIIKNKIFATLNHGPVASSATTVLRLTENIIQLLRQKKIILLRWLPPLNLIEHGQDIDKLLLKSGKIIADSEELNWATNIVSLVPDQKVLEGSFSSNHRRSIKKCQALNYNLTELSTEREIEFFSEGYRNMYKMRGNKVADLLTIQAGLKALYNKFKNDGNGFFMCVYDNDKMIGGISVAYTNKTAFYHIGFMDRNFKNFPVNHLLFYSAMLKAKAEGKLEFDLGGYAIDTSDKQVLNINRFKDGFKGQLLKYPNTRLIAFNFWGKMFYSILRYKRRVQKKRV